MLTYEESSQLMNDPTFRGRVKVACLKYADYIMNEPGNVTAHNVRMKWAGKAFQMPDSVAQEIQPPTVMDAAVQDKGAAVTDLALQSAVEGVINKMM